MSRRILSILLSIALALPMGLIGGGNEASANTISVSSGTGRYYCTTCSQEISNTSSHTRVDSVAHGTYQSYRWYCSSCSQTLYSSGSHTRYCGSASATGYKCSSCGKTSTSSIGSHQVTCGTYSASAYKCSTCGSTTNGSHNQVTCGTYTASSYKCSRCGATSSSGGTHTKYCSHSNKTVVGNPEGCEIPCICGCTMNHGYSLIRCNDCGSSVKVNDHTPEIAEAFYSGGTVTCGTFQSTGYRCNSCGSTSSSSGTHKKNCNGSFSVTQYKCSACSATSSSSGTHMKNCGGSSQVTGYKCSSCGTSLSSSSSHYKSCSGSPYVSQYKCSACSETSSYSGSHYVNTTVSCNGSLKPVITMTYQSKGSNVSSNSNVRYGNSITLAGAQAQKNYTITLNATANGGSCSQGSGTVSEKHEKWTINGSSYNVGSSYSSSLTSNTTATAVWNTYGITLPSASKAGRRFLGWDTSSSATTGTYSGGQTFSNTANTTLYAIYSRGVSTTANDINVTYSGTNVPFVVNAETGAVVEYTHNGVTQTEPFEFKRVGTYEISWVAHKDDDYYDDTTGTNTVKINKKQLGTESVTAPTLTDITYRDKLSKSDIQGGSVQGTGEDGEIGGTFSFMEPDKKLNAGENTVMLRFTPDNTDDYEIIENIAVPVYVEKYTPVLDETQIEGTEIQWGDTIGKWSPVVNATSDVEGSWVWDEPDEVIEELGTVVRKAHFVPDDLDNYEIGESIDVPVNVVKRDGTPSVKPVAIDGVYEQSLNDISFEGGTILDHDGQEITGVFTWEDPDEKVKTGTHAYNMLFTPDNTDTHKVVKLTVDVTVEKMNPIVTWADVGSIIYEDTLIKAELTHYKSHVPGTFSIQDGDTVFEVGEHDITLVFTPDDTENYNVLTSPAKITVKKNMQKAPEGIVAERCGKTVWDDSQYQFGDDDSGWVYTHTGKLLGTRSGVGMNNERVMEYSLHGANMWQDCTDEVTDLVPKGVYDIRWKETKNYGVSPAITVEVLRGLYEYRITYVLDRYGRTQVERYLEGQPLGYVIDQPEIRFYHCLGWFDKMGVKVDEKYVPTENMSVMGRYQQFTDEEIAELLAKEFNDKWAGKTIDDLTLDDMAEMLSEYAQLPELSLKDISDESKDLIQAVNDYYEAHKFMEDNPISDYDHELNDSSIGGARHFIDRYDELRDGVKEQCTDEYKEGIESVRDWIEKYDFLDSNDLGGIDEVSEANIEKAMDINNHYDDLRDGTKDKFTDEEKEQIHQIKTGIAAYDFDNTDWDGVSDIEDKRAIVDAYDSLDDDVKDKVKEKDKVEDFRNQVDAYDFIQENTPITTDSVDAYDALDEDVKKYIPDDFKEEVEDMRNQIEADKFEAEHTPFTKDDLDDYEGLSDKVKDKLSEDFQKEVQDIKDTVAAEEFEKNHPLTDGTDILDDYKDLPEGVRDKLSDDYKEGIEELERQKLHDDFENSFNNTDMDNPDDVDKLLEEWGKLPDNVKDMFDDETKDKLNQLLEEKKLRDLEENSDSLTPEDIIDIWESLSDEAKENASDTVKELIEEAYKKLAAKTFEEEHQIEPVDDDDSLERMQKLLEEYEEYDKTYISDDYKSDIKDLENDIEAYLFEKDNPDVTTKDVLNKYDALDSGVKGYITDDYKQKIEALRKQLTPTPTPKPANTGGSSSGGNSGGNSGNSGGNSGSSTPRPSETTAKPSVTRNPADDRVNTWQDYENLSDADKKNISDDKKKELAEEAEKGVNSLEDYEKLPDWVKDLISDDKKKELAEEAGKDVSSLEDYKKLPDWVKDILGDDFVKDLIDDDMTLDEYEKLPDWAKDLVDKDTKDKLADELKKKVNSVDDYENLPDWAKDLLGDDFVKDLVGSNITLEEYENLPDDIKATLDEGVRNKLEAEKFERDNPDVTPKVVVKYDNLPDGVKDYISDEYKGKIEDVRSINNNEVQAEEFESKYSPDVITTLDKYDELPDDVKSFISEDYKDRLEDTQRYKDALDFEENNPASVEALEKYEALSKEEKEYISDDYKNHLVAIKFEQVHPIRDFNVLNSTNKQQINSYIKDFDTLTAAQKKWVSEEYQLWIENMRDELEDQDAADAFRIKWQGNVTEANAKEFIEEFELLTDRAREKTGMKDAYSIWCKKLGVQEVVGTIKLSYKVSKGKSIVVRAAKGCKINWLRTSKRVKIFANGRIRGKKLGKCTLKGLTTLNGDKYTISCKVKVVKKGKIAGVPKYNKKQKDNIVIGLSAKKGEKLGLTLDKWDEWDYKKKRVKVNKKKGTAKFKKRGITRIKVADGSKKIIFKVSVK